MKDVVLIFRKPFESSHSIIFLFETLFKTFQAQSVPVTKYMVPYHSKGFVKRLFNTLSLLVFKGRIVHITGDIYYAILGVWFSKRVITIHDLSFLHRTRGLSHFTLKWLWVKLPCMFADKITVVSYATRIDLQKYVDVPESKLKVVYNFIDDRFQETTRNFASKCPKILQIGCSFNKNIERLIISIEQLDCELLIIGRLTHSQIMLLKQKKIRYNNFFDLSIDDYHKRFLDADFLCYISTVEGFGMPIIEAQATGLPVVTSNCSSMPEVAGKGAIFVDPFSVYSIRQGIDKIIADKDLREQTIKDGYLNTKRFSKEKIASDYNTLYQSLRRKSH